MAVDGTPVRGEGKTLQEAIDDYAEQKAAQLLDELGDASHREKQRFFRSEENWSPVVITLQVQHHNQWVRAYRVQDSGI
jgi:hypothetical protein